jgi:hypothetical protein
VSPGKIAKTKVTLYNNDQTTHTYQLKVILPEIPLQSKKQVIFVSPGYSPVPDSNWVRPKTGNLLGFFSPIKTVKVSAGKSVSFPVEILIANAQDYYGKKWEAVIMAQPEKGEAGFVRLRIETQSK